MPMNRRTGFFLILTVFLLPMGFALGAESAAMKAKQKAEAEGYSFLASHEEIVEKAKKEGKLRVIRSLAGETFNGMVSAFKQKYPFITDVSAFEFKGTEGRNALLWSFKRGEAGSGTFST